MGAGCGLLAGCLSAFHRVCLCGCAGSLYYFADVSKIGQDTAVCSAFCPLSRFMLVALLANMALFRVLRGFLAGFVVAVCVCVILVVCVDCGAFVCVSG